MAQAAVLVSQPWGETCSLESWRAANHLALGFASATGCAGLLCQGGTYPGWKKGAALWQFYTSPPPLWDGVLRDGGGSPGGGITVPSGAGGVHPDSPLVTAYQALPELCYPECSAGVLTLGS